MEIVKKKKLKIFKNEILNENVIGNLIGNLMRILIRDLTLYLFEKK